MQINQTFDDPKTDTICITSNNCHQSTIRTGTVQEIIRQQLKDIANTKVSEATVGYDNAFIVGDLADVHQQYMKWKALLPRIKPFYAVKCNPDQTVVNYLASLGVGFDCASQQEIQQIPEIGVDPTRMIYANPCKQPSFVHYAAKHNVSLMTFDNMDELYKIKEVYPNAKLVLRILTDDSSAQVRLGLKYGAPPETIDYLLKTAKKLDLNVVGVSFHVGSGCTDAQAYADAVALARNVFAQAEAIGYRMTLLNCGGGMSGSNNEHGITFEDVAATLGQAVDKLFPSPDIEVIAEPGRFFVSSAFTACVQVIGRRALIPEEESADIQQQKYMYYLNDGLFGSYLMRFTDNERLNFRVVFKNGVFVYEDKKQQEEAPTFISNVWGPTCSSFDSLLQDVRLPRLELGDWICQENMGAYATCAATNFNGFEKTKIIYTNSTSIGPHNNGM
ncbi:ornithine decarboxylase [Zychaea mexicana]|uniref:ornithine decarboxylase n=1 Tax=Zychaea mexicana TaxID=64656 RepID=UPI0022FE8FB2|nr:ornithine decarboxylase [Zychaea mexicana]KAI9493483.1 ornithine decarboxylase [Zychaea mexicana]